MTAFYGEFFRASAQSFQVCVFVVATSTAGPGLGTALAATGHQRLSLFIALAGAGANVGLRAALIPTYGHVGAAYAFLITTTGTALAGFAAAHRLVVHIDVVERCRHRWSLGLR